MTTFNNSFSEEIWKSNYRCKDLNELSIDDTLNRVAKSVASVEKTPELRKEWEEKFKFMLSDFKVVSGGRILANAGATYKGAGLINCYTAGRPKYDCDSMEGIMEVLKNQTLTLKSEGGWGMNFSFIRPRGAFIHTLGVETPGVVRFVELFDKSSEIITAGSGKEGTKQKKGKEKIRKGAQLGCLCVWHPGIYEWIRAKRVPGQFTKLNLSVVCDDVFIAKVIRYNELQSLLSQTKDNHEEQLKLSQEMLSVDKWDLIFPDTTFSKYKEEWDGDIYLWKSKGYPVKVYETTSAITLWEEIMRSTYDYNDPGVLFMDRANKTYLANYVGEKIQECNACVAKGTMVNTPHGYKKVENIKEGDLISTLHPIGYEPVKTVDVIKDFDVYEVKFSDGGVQYVTENHIYHSKKQGGGASKSVNRLKLKDLSVGDFVQVYPTELLNKVIEVEKFEHGVMLGLLIGDGSCGKYTYIASSKDDIEFNNNIKKLFNKYGFEFFKDYDKTGDKSIKLNFTLDSSKRLKELFSIPDQFTCSEKFIDEKYLNDYSYCLGILNGIIASDGNVNLKSNHPQIRISTVSEALATDLRRLLLNIGVHGRITKRKVKDSIINGRCIHSDKDQHCINISGFDFLMLSKYVYNNIDPKKAQKIKQSVYNYRMSGNSRMAEIISIKYHGKSDVYDLYCEDSDTWITDGYVQQGCSEQTMPPNSCCNLISINLTQFITENGDVDYELLKKCARYTLRFSDNINDLAITPLPEYQRNLQEMRRVGVGIMGWASLLYMLKIKFASHEAFELKEKIMSAICYSIVDESVNLAKEKGMFTGCDPKTQSEHLFWDQIKLPVEIRNKIKKNGIRNSALFSIQPTGNTSILANIVSGGCEPVFMQEYIRTVIIPIIPDEIKSKCPNFFEGDYFPNDYFKETTEGQDKILKYTHTDGIVYKIDRNRGLTKEVLCEDYGVRWLKQHNLYDKTADYLVVANGISVDDHVKDLSEFTKWIDASVSKTINVPNNYKYEEFRNVYLNAYKTGTIKGITTYRDGTRMSVLSSVKKKEHEVIRINVNKAPKRPTIVPSEVYHGSNNKCQYYVIVGLAEGNVPFEIFIGTNEDKDGKYIPLSEKTGKTKKVSRGNYEFISDSGKKYMITSGIHNDESADALARAISLALRHGASTEFAVSQLEKSKGPMHSYGKVMARALKRYIKDGTESCGCECPECNSSLVRESGCKICKNCGYSVC